MLFDESGGSQSLDRRVSGVLISDVGRAKTDAVPVLARNEVIVSAGTMTSPRLLMLSGIGPASQLAWHGIPVVVDNPKVGQGLQDHPCKGIGALLLARRHGILLDLRALQSWA